MGLCYAGGVVVQTSIQSNKANARKNAFFYAPVFGSGEGEKQSLSMRVYPQTDLPRPTLLD